jgi:hypothetical protein
MSTTQEEVLHPGQKTPDRPALEAVIGENVLRGLGKPDNLHMVQVRQVFGGKYRVNVFVRADAATFKVAHSYFLEADDDGNVLASSPAITRLY